MYANGVIVLEHCHTGVAIYRLTVKSFPESEDI